MKKVCQWKVTADGETHIVRYETFKSVFDVYVDDELAARVPRRNEEGTDMEEELRVGSKVCQFVVYDGTPDLAVDGILLGAEESMRRAALGSRLLRFFGGLAMTVIGTLTILLWLGFEAAGQGIQGGWMALIGMIAFTVTGVVLMISGLLKKREY